MTNRTPIRHVGGWDGLPLRKICDVVQGLAVHPGELLVTFHSLVLLGGLEELGVLVLQALPLSNLLVEAEIAP